METKSRINETQTRRVIGKYQLGEFLGAGAFSEVFLAKHQEDGGIFAVKIISNKTLAENIKIKECISNQLAIHKVLEPSNHIVRFYQLIETKNNCYFVYQYCQGGNLHQMIKKTGILGEKRALQIFNQLVEGLKILRKHNIMHRDLKPENILLKGDNFKLGDFAFCKQLGVQSMTKTMLGSPLYMAPQVLRGQAYSVNADIWSIGVILYEMLYGRCPFQSSSIASLISTICGSSLSFNPSIIVSQNIKQFIGRCLQRDCRLRMTWEQFFVEVRKLSKIEGDNFDKNQNFAYPVPIKVQRHQSSSKIQSQADCPTPIRTKPFSKSKFEQFKQKYKVSDNKNGQDLSIKIQQKYPTERYSIQIQKPKELKISYNQMTIQHDACCMILKAVFDTLEKRERKLYPYVVIILKEVKRVLERIYSRINLEDIQMLPVLSIVKYELIQIENVNSEVQKTLPIQLSTQRCNSMPIPFDEQWKTFLQTCKY